MTPPEPDPPAEYTYSTSQSIALNAVTGTLYKNIQLNGVDCKLNASDESSNPTSYPDLILYEVDGTQYAYFTRGSAIYYGILANNSAMNVSSTVYRIYNGSVTQQGVEYLENSVPSDYYANIKSGNFTLVQRS